MYIDPFRLFQASGSYHYKQEQKQNNKQKKNRPTNKTKTKTKEQNKKQTNKQIQRKNIFHICYCIESNINSITRLLFEHALREKEENEAHALACTLLTTN